MEWTFVHGIRHQCIVLASSAEEVAKMFGGELTKGEIYDQYLHKIEVSVIRLGKELFTEKVPPSPTWAVERLLFRKGDFTALINVGEDHANLLIKELQVFQV